MNRRHFVQGLAATTLIGCGAEKPEAGRKAKRDRKKDKPAAGDGNAKAPDAPKGGGGKEGPLKPAPLPETMGRPEMMALEDKVEGLHRRAHLYVPGSYSPKTPTPLILGCHGRKMGAQSVFASYGWREMCERRGWLGVFPESDHPERDNRLGHDNNFFEQLMKRVDATYNLDRDRVYGTGFSAGCHRSYAFASAHSEWVRALAVSGGTVLHRRDDAGNGNPAFHKAGPISVLHFHGGMDTSTPISGGEKIGHEGETNYVVPLFESLGEWADYYGCTEKKSPALPEGCPPERGLTTRVWRNEKTGVEIRAVIDPKLDHSWPTKYGVKSATRWFSELG